MTDLQSADRAFLDRLSEAVPGLRVLPAEPRYLEEPRDRWAGQAGAVVQPGSVEEVSAIVTACAAARVPLIPYGGGTGLVGGQLMPDGPQPVILSLERMNAVREVFAEENVAVVEAGCILADVQSAAREAGRLFPLSLASEGSARIGGLLATNAGGVNVLRYGNARAQVLGLEAVLPNGSIWHGLKRLHKDNTGYDLRNLLVGSEGTLGVITAAALKLAPHPVGEGTALLAVASPRAALELLAIARAQMAEGISAFEIMHRAGLEFLAETLPDVKRPWSEDPPEWMVLIEVGLAEGLDPATALERLFEAGAEHGLVTDGMVAQSETQRDELWAVRERIPEANRKIGSVSSHDISLPLSAVPEFIEVAGPKLAELAAFRINCFGHLGDGNLHYNVFPTPGKARADYEAERPQVKRIVHDLVHGFGGSVSAEHGIGRLKVDDLERYGDPAKLAAMRAIKDTLDPAGIMNPGAVLR
ncbi:FAD-binding oxidoreductase [Pseudaestuariivita sp.]|uniref:FAD-binding oxidoreductase n=1 Tax=Pseudaestuariivita sp. TaxID=2211669 RepID=UPI004059647E